MHTVAWAVPPVAPVSKPPQIFWTPTVVEANVGPYKIVRKYLLWML